MLCVRNKFLILCEKINYTPAVQRNNIDCNSLQEYQENQTYKNFVIEMLQW